MRDVLLKHYLFYPWNITFFRNILYMGRCTVPFTAVEGRMRTQDILPPPDCYSLPAISTGRSVPLYSGFSCVCVAGWFCLRFTDLRCRCVFWLLRTSPGWLPRSCFVWRSGDRCGGAVPSFDFLFCICARLLFLYLSGEREALSCLEFCAGLFCCLGSSCLLRLVRLLHYLADRGEKGFCVPFILPSLFTYPFPVCVQPASHYFTMGGLPYSSTFLLPTRNGSAYTVAC